MNYSLVSLEIAVVLLGLGLLLLDLWTPPAQRRLLGYAAALGLGFILLFSLSRAFVEAVPGEAFGGMFVLDPLALFFKRLFLVTAIGVAILSVDFADRIASGVTEFYALGLFALAGMMVAASVNDFSLLFVAVELITVTFYVLASFQRGRVQSLEAGVKYLILGAVASALLVYGIALIYGRTGHLDFPGVARVCGDLSQGLGRDPLFLGGVLLVLVGLGFKLAIVPMQMWAPDVYQGAPTPTTAFLAIGSKAAGVVLLLRVLVDAVPDLAAQWHRLLLVLAGASILYGNLCAIPQKNLKRLLGYSSIAHGGYLLLGLAALSDAGNSAVLFYLGGYLFTLLAAFLVLSVVFREARSEEIADLAGLHQRSPFLAATLATSVVSLAGIPPLVGFFGKFLLFRAALLRGAEDPAYYWAVGIAIVGVVISLYYYFGVVRAAYWDAPSTRCETITMSRPVRWTLGMCLAAMLWLGLAPGFLVNVCTQVVALAR